MSTKREYVQQEGAASINGLEVEAGGGGGGAGVEGGTPHQLAGQQGTSLAMEYIHTMIQTQVLIYVCIYCICIPMYIFYTYYFLSLSLNFLFRYSIVSHKYLWHLIHV